MLNFEKIDTQKLLSIPSKALRLIYMESAILDRLAFGKSNALLPELEDKWKELKKRLIRDNLYNQLSETNQIVAINPHFVNTYVEKLLKEALKSIDEKEAKLFFENQVQFLLEDIKNPKVVKDYFDIATRYLVAVKSIENHFKFASKSILGEVFSFIKTIYFPSKT